MIKLQPKSRARHYLPERVMATGALAAAIVAGAGGPLARAADAPQGEIFAAGDNYAVQRFADNCTLTADLGDAVIGVSRDREKILSLFFSSRLHDLTGAEALTLTFGAEPPLSLSVARVVTVSGAPVIMLDIPSGIGRMWRLADTLAVANGAAPVGTFAMGEAQTEGPDVLQECVSLL